MFTFDDIKRAWLFRQISEGFIPRYLCKFRAIDENCLRGIKNSSLWFSRLDSFNDPFEGRIIFSKGLKESTLRLLNLKATQGNLSILAKEVENGLNRLRDSQSVCCFSNSDNDILLWSHYANWHTGVCLKYDLLKDLDFFSPIFSISYHPKMKPSDNVNDFLIHLFQRKFIEWEYEKEYRIIRSNEPGFQTYNPEALVEVIFGCKTEVTDKIKIKSLLGDGLNYKQCQLNKEEFKLDIVDAVFE